MSINFTIKRTEAWRQAQAIARGANVPEAITIQFDPAELPVDVRAMLARKGYYQETVRGLYYDCDCQFVGFDTSMSSYGKIPFVMDTDGPTPNEIADTIRAAFRELENRRLKAEAEREAKKQADMALAAEWAALPLSDRASAHGVCMCIKDGKLSASGATKYPRGILEAHVPAAWKEAVAMSDILRTVAAGDKAQADRALLCEFLQYVPQDALVGALKRMAADKVDVDDLRDQIEDASSSNTIFEDEDA